MSYSIGRNISFFTIASILQKIISFVYFTYVARSIGVENTGQYFFAIAFTTIFAILADFGLASVLTREAAKSPELSTRYLGTILLMKIGAGFISFALICVVTYFLHYSVSLRGMIVLSGITMIFDNIHSAFFAFLRAKKNLLFEAIGVVGSQALTLIIGTTVLWLHGPLIGLIWAYTIPSAFNALFSMCICQKKYGHIDWRGIFDSKLRLFFLVTAIPFAFSGFIGRLYAYADALIMSKMLTPEHLGWWSVPYKMTFAFQFIPIAVTASIYPVFSELWRANKIKTAELYEKSWRYLLILVMPLTAGGIIFARPIILMLYGPHFLPSVIVLQILLASLACTFIIFINGALLNAIEKQHLQTAILSATLFCSVMLNLLLIPRYAIMGAAFSALISNLLLCCSGLIILLRLVPISLVKIIAYFFHILFPTLLSTGIALIALHFTPLWFAILALLVPYAILLVITGVVSMTELNGRFIAIFHNR